MRGDNSVERLVNETAAAGERVGVVPWGEDTSGDDALLTGDLCIWAPEVARPLGWRWVWTVTPTEPEARLAPLGLVMTLGR